MNPAKRDMKTWLEENSDEFWDEYKRTEKVGMRNVLVEKFLPLVNYHAERLGAKLHDKLDLDDLKQVGIIMPLAGDDMRTEVSVRTAKVSSSYQLALATEQVVALHPDAEFPAEMT